MKRKLTEWYPGHVKPVRDGVYQREYSFGVKYCLYKKGKWFMNEAKPEMAVRDWLPYSGYQMLPWRGIKK